MRKTGWLWHEVFNWHNTGNGSGFFPPGGFIQPYTAFDTPESKGRFASLVHVSGFTQNLVALEANPATDAQLLAVHTPEYLRKLEELDPTGGDAGESAYFGPQGLSIAKLAAGAVVRATNAVVKGEVENAYALVRPAGHHAEADRGRGFCLFANSSIAARAAQRDLDVRRVAIVDWDVHHGNGTEAAFWDDDSVLTISLHQDRLYPTDSGFREDNGGDHAPGTNINIPLPAGTGDGGYLRALDLVTLPALERFRPELIIVGSGMDASALDPLGRMVVTSTGFRAMSRRMIDAAGTLCDGRIVFAQEGGYSGHYVPFCGMATLEELTSAESGVDDPYLTFFTAYPQLQLEPWQRDAIDAAAELVKHVPDHR